MAQRILASYPAGLGYWSLFARDDPGRFLGWASLPPYDAGAVVEIGWWVIRSVWGRGFAAEAGRTILRHGFEVARLDRTSAYVHPDNLASARVARKIGMDAGVADLYLGEPCLRFDAPPLA